MDPFSLDHIIPSPLPAYTGKSSSGPYGPLFASIILNFQKSALLSFSSFHSSRPEAPPLLREVFTPHGTRQHSGTLSHLYVFKERVFMGLTRVELVTPSLSEKCSNQLSYRPIKRGRKGRKPLGGGHLSRRKEVIQPHFPVRLPCYDFTPLTRHTFGTVPLYRLDQRLRVPPTRVV